MLTNLFSLENVETEAAAVLTAARTSLDTALAADPLEIPLILASAQADTETYAADLIAGITGTLDGDTLSETAMADLGDRVTKQLEETWDTGSPSKVFEKLAGFAVDGLVQGLEAGTNPVKNQARDIGAATAAGVVAGLRSGIGSVARAAKAMGLALANALRKELQIESPSKVTEEIGVQTVKGFIVGVDDSLPLFKQLAFSLATQVKGPFKKVGTEIAQAIGAGFAEEGISIISSIGGIIDDAYDNALSKADQFKAIGKTIASNLFEGQGTDITGVTGGGPGATGLQEAFLKVLGNSSGFQQAIAKQVEEVIGKDANDKDIIRGLAGFSTDTSTAIGRENIGAFLTAGKGVREYIQTLIDSGRPVSEAIREGKVYRDQIVALAQSYGWSSETINRLVNDLGLGNDQLVAFAKNVDAVTIATKAATAEAEKALAAQKAAEANQKAAQDLAEKQAAWAKEQADAAKEAADAAEEARKRAQEDEDRRLAAIKDPPAYLAPPVFRDLIIQSPSGDPEAVALATANRVAFQIRR